jgi:hypothetical protein
VHRAEPYPREFRVDVVNVVRSGEGWRAGDNAAMESFFALL